MKKQAYLEPAVQVLSLAPMQETLQATSDTNLMLIGGTDLEAPVEINETDFNSIFGL